MAGAAVRCRTGSVRVRAQGTNGGACRIPDWLWHHRCGRVPDPSHLNGRNPGARAAELATQERADSDFDKSDQWQIGASKGPQGTVLVNAISGQARVLVRERPILP